jgi:hypothetical protein
VRALLTFMPNSSFIRRHRYPTKRRRKPLRHLVDTEQMKIAVGLVPPADQNRAPSAGDTVDPDELKDDLETYEQL